MNPYMIIKRPLATEKVIRMMEASNTLCFAVDKKATKQQVKDAVGTAFNAKVAAVRTVITPKGEKHAYVRFAPETKALDIATNLGIM